MEKKGSLLKRYVSVGLAVGVLMSGLGGFGGDVSAASKIVVKDAKSGKPVESPVKPAKPGLNPVKKRVYKALPIKPMPKIPRGEIVAFGGDITSPGFKEVSGLEKRKQLLSEGIVRAKAEQKKRGVTLEVVDSLQKRVDVMRATYRYKGLQGESLLIENLDRKLFSMRSEIGRVVYPTIDEIKGAKTEKQVAALELRVANSVKTVVVLDPQVKKLSGDVGTHEKFLLDYKRGLKAKFEGLKENARLVGQLRTYDALYVKYDAKIVTDQIAAVLKKRGVSKTEEARILAGVRTELSAKLVLGNTKLATRVLYENSFNNDADTVTKRGSLLNGVVNEVVKTSQGNARVIEEILKKNGVTKGNLHFDGRIVIF